MSTHVDLTVESLREVDNAVCMKLFVGGPDHTHRHITLLLL
jgi:hypothetical protein